jgi:hypothetical protein
VAYNARPTIRRLILGGMLKQAREANGVKIDTVVEALGVSRPVVYRQEGGIAPVYDEQIHTLVSLYSITDQNRIDKWLRWAKKSRDKGPWVSSGGTLGPTFEDYREAEWLAEELRVWEPCVIPGLLQTKEYSQAIIGTDATVHPADSGRQAELLKLREERKQILGRTDPLPPRFWAIVGEAAVRTPPVPGDRISHREQLQHLLNLGETQAKIQILPMEAGLHTGLSGAFSLLTLDDSVDMVFREGYGDGVFLDEPEHVRSYRVRYEALQVQALAPADSRRYLHDVLKELGDENR